LKSRSKSGTARQGLFFLAGISHAMMSPKTTDINLLEWFSDLQKSLEKPGLKQTKVAKTDQC